MDVQDYIDVPPPEDLACEVPQFEEDNLACESFDDEAMLRDLQACELSPLAEDATMFIDEPVEMPSLEMSSFEVSAVEVNVADVDGDAFAASTVDAFSAPAILANQFKPESLCALDDTDADRTRTQTRRVRTLKYAAEIAHSIAAASNGAHQSSDELANKAAYEFASRDALDSDVFDSTNAHARQFIVFTLDRLNYALPLANMMAIERALPTTPLPFLPAWHTGIANLRGDILSVVDLRVFLRMSPAPRTRSLRIIVTRSLNDDTVVGLIVDSVSYIRRLDEGLILPPVTARLPAASTVERRRNYVRGMYNDDDAILAVLDIEELLRVSAHDTQPAFDELAVAN